MTNDQDGYNPSELPLLLPFYVNGTLSADEKARVEAALAADPDLRVELEAVQRIAALVRRGGAQLAPSDETGAPDRLLGLLSRIDAESGPATAGARRGGLFGRRPQAGRSEPRTTAWVWKPAFAAAAALAVVQLGVIAYQAKSQNSYVSLSGPQTAPAVSSKRLFLRLSPTAKWSDVESLLSDANLTIVGGPRAETLDVAIGGDGTADDMVLRLRASPLVAFAAPES